LPLPSPDCIRSEELICFLVESNVTNVISVQVGPIDVERHSKLPYFLRLQGSVVPRMIIPIMLVGAWSTIITWLDQARGKNRKAPNLLTRRSRTGRRRNDADQECIVGVNQLLLTVLGFVVAFTLSFRTSTAYER
jgi:hypothetical protein